MKIAIISSTQDLASINIKEELIKEFQETKELFDNHKVYSLNNIKIYTTDKESVFYEHIDHKIDADIFVFISMHKSKAEIPTLSVHSIGNWANDNQVGGSKRKLVMSPSLLIRKAFLNLNEYGKDSGYEIVYEATHHGPYLDKPTFFIEIGSTEHQWADKKAGSIISKSLLNALKDSKQEENIEVALGIGGLHTCPEFNKVVLRNKIALSHICPKYMLQSLDKEIIEQAITKTQGQVSLVILDWKGLAQEKQRISSILEEIGIRYIKTSSL